MNSIVGAMAIAWFRPEDYDRIRAMSDDELFETYEEWRSFVQGRLDAKISAQLIEKVMVDPDDLLEFAEEHFAGRITAEVRAVFAANELGKKYDKPKN
jgi:hypothetical protein